jgi:hypothetical protein
LSIQNTFCTACAIKIPSPEKKVNKRTGELHHFFEGQKRGRVFTILSFKDYEGECKRVTSMRSPYHEQFVYGFEDNKESMKQLMHRETIRWIHEMGIYGTNLEPFSLSN